MWVDAIIEIRLWVRTAKEYRSAVDADGTKTPMVGVERI